MKNSSVSFPWLGSGVGNPAACMFKFTESLRESNKATIAEENLIGCWESSAANQIFSAIVALGSL